MKRFFSILLTLILSTALTGCSLITITRTEAPEESAEENENLGRYYLVSRDGSSFDVEGQYLRLDEDDECKLVLGEGSLNGTWKLRKGELTLAINGEEYEGELEDGTIEIRIFQSRCIFMKGKTAAAAYISEHQGAVPVTMPSAELPATEEPTTEEPATEEPATEEPTTEEPTTEEPTTEEPTTEEQTTEEPTTEEPTTEEPETKVPNQTAEPGCYQIMAYTFGDEEMTQYTMLAFKNYVGLVLEEDGTGSIAFGQKEPFGDSVRGYYHTLEIYDITWNENQILMEGDGIDYLYEDGMLVLQNEEETFSFRPCDRLLTEDQYRWNGTWYGCLYFDGDNVGPTEYLTDTGYGLYIVIDLDEYGEGSMTVFEPNEVFGDEMLMSAEVYANGNELCMSSGYMELVLEETTLKITLDADYWTFSFSEESEIYEIYDYYDYRDDTCHVSFYFKMLPWGMAWPDEQAALIPDYEAYEDSVYNEDLPIDFMLTDWSNY